MPRPMWNGSITFGLVNVPIKLYNAIKKKNLSFHQLRANDGCRIRLKRICESDGKDVPADNIVKGYEVSPDRYVTITNEEINSLNPKPSRSIEIEDFVDIAQIDPIYFEHSYYLVPDKGATKAYYLLLTTMKKTKKIAIAKLILRNKEYLAAIRPVKSALLISTMHFADEIVSAEEIDELPKDDAEPNPRELAMAEQLVKSLTADFNPHKYRDEYRLRILDLIEQKAEGQSVVIQPVAEQGAKVIDLMSALEASLAAINKKAPAKDRRKKARA